MNIHTIFIVHLLLYLSAFHENCKNAHLKHLCFWLYIFFLPQSSPFVLLCWHFVFQSWYNSRRSKFFKKKRLEKWGIPLSWHLMSYINLLWSLHTRTTDIQWRHKSKKSEILGRCGKQNMLWLYLKIRDCLHTSACRVVWKSENM